MRPSAPRPASFAITAFITLPRSFGGARAGFLDRLRRRPARFRPGPPAAAGTSRARAISAVSLRRELFAATLRELSDGVAPLLDQRRNHLLRLGVVERAPLLDFPVHQRRLGHPQRRQPCLSFAASPSVFADLSMNAIMNSSADLRCLTPSAWPVPLHSSRSHCSLNFDACISRYCAATARPELALDRLARARQRAPLVLQEVRRSPSRARSAARAERSRRRDRTRRSARVRRDCRSTARACRDASASTATVGSASRSDGSTKRSAAAQ